MLKQHGSCRLALGAVGAVIVIALIATFKVSPAYSAEKDQELVIRDRMVSISKQLGVTCAYCHNLSNFRDSTNKAYQIAKEHIHVTNYLNSKSGFNGKPAVDCLICHRGQAKPEVELKEKEH